MRRVTDYALSAFLVLLAAVVVIGAWIVLANGLRLVSGVATIWNGWAGPLVIGAAALVAAASALALLAQRSLSTARALAVVAVSATASIFDRWSAAPPTLSALAVPVALFIFPALFSLATISRPRWRAPRAAAWIATATAAAILLTLRDPFLDPLCAGACGTSTFEVSAQPEIVLATRWIVAVLGLAALAAGIGAALPRAGTGGRPAIPPLTALLTLGVASLAMLAEAAWASGLIQSAPDLAAARLISLALLGVSHLAASAVIARRRAAVVALADELTSETSPRDDLAARLQTALRDPAVRVGYPRADGTTIDADGHASAHAIPGETSTLVRRVDGIVAVIVHPARIAGDELATAFGPAAGLALANARTRALIRATLLELQAMRVRLVDAGDDVRREIERNLHDGVQQTLLVLQYELALAAGDTGSGQSNELESIREGVQRLTERTRELGHGLFPMSLDDVGLDAALQRLADDSSVPFEPDVDLPRRPPRSVERTAYLVARDAVSAAAGRARVVVRGKVDAVIIDVVGGPLTAVSRDRIDALGGRIEQLESGMKVVLPCASS